MAAWTWAGSRRSLAAKKYGRRERKNAAGLADADLPGFVDLPGFPDLAELPGIAGADRDHRSLGLLTDEKVRSCPDRFKPDHYGQVIDGADCAG